MKHLAALVFATALYALPSSASAQQATEFNFDDGENVAGNIMRPEGEIIDVPRDGIRPSLIRIRENFVPEMLRAAENL